jgi:hypothetical protein
LEKGTEKTFLGWKKGTEKKFLDWKKAQKRQIFTLVVHGRNFRLSSLIKKEKKNISMTHHN